MYYGAYPSLQYGCEFWGTTFTRICYYRRVSRLSTVVAKEKPITPRYTLPVAPLTGSLAVVRPVDKANILPCVAVDKL